VNGASPSDIIRFRIGGTGKQTAVSQGWSV